MDITPQVAEGRQAIRAYVETGFEVSCVRHTGAVIVFPEETVSWNFSGPLDELELDHLASVFAATPVVELLLIGSGQRFAIVPPALCAAIRERGPAVECMDTGAACRTYNVLLAEERRVAAALLPVG